MAGKSSGSKKKVCYNTLNDHPLSGVVIRIGTGGEVLCHNSIIRCLLYAQPANTGVGHVISSNTEIMSRLIAPWTEEHVTAAIADG